VIRQTLTWPLATDLKQTLKRIRCGDRQHATQTRDQSDSAERHGPVRQCFWTLNSAARFLFRRNSIWPCVRARTKRATWTQIDLSARC